MEAAEKTSALVAATPNVPIKGVLTTQVCLTMIVGSEEKVIKRALDSAAPHITCYCICYNGHDGTQEIIKKTMEEHGIPGVMHVHQWYDDYGKSRTLSMQETRKYCKNEGWAWVLDSDDSLDGAPLPNSWWEDQDDSIGSFRINIKHGGVIHPRAQIFSNKFNWCYEDSRHEYAFIDWQGKPEGYVISDIPFPPNICNVARTEGCRSADASRYYGDAIAIKTKDLVRKPNNPRCLFYLAESYRWAELPEQAKVAYQNRINCTGGFAQERYMSYVYSMWMEPDIKKKLEMCWKAIQIDSTRLEGPYHVMKAARNSGVYPHPNSYELYAIGSIPKERSISPNYLFPIGSIYNEGLYDDELSLCAHWIGRNEEALVAAKRGLPMTTDDQLPRVLKNIEVFKKAIGEK